MLYLNLFWCQMICLLVPFDRYHVKLFWIFLTACPWKFSQIRWVILELPCRLFWLALLICTNKLIIPKWSVFLAPFNYITAVVQCLKSIVFRTVLFHQCTISVLQRCRIKLWSIIIDDRKFLKSKMKDFFFTGRFSMNRGFQIEYSSRAYVTIHYT